MDTVFKMSSMTEESLKSFIKDFGKNGLAKVPNENFCLITFQVDGVAEHLDDSSLLRSKSLTQYVEGFTYCSVPKFKMVFVNKSLSILIKTQQVGLSWLLCLVLMSCLKSRRPLVLQWQYMISCNLVRSGISLESM